MSKSNKDNIYKYAYEGLQKAIGDDFSRIIDLIQELKYENNRLHIKIDLLEQKIDQMKYTWPQQVPYPTITWESESE